MAHHSSDVAQVTAGVFGLRGCFRESLEHREGKPHSWPQCSLLESPKLDPEGQRTANFSLLYTRAATLRRVDTT